MSYGHGFASGIVEIYPLSDKPENTDILNSHGTYLIWDTTVRRVCEVLADYLSAKPKLFKGFLSGRGNFKLVTRETPEGHLEIQIQGDRTDYLFDVLQSHISDFDNAAKIGQISKHPTSTRT